MIGALLVQQGTTAIPEGPAWVIALTSSGLLVLAIVKEAFKAIAAKREGNGHAGNGKLATSERAAAVESATLIAATHENRRLIESTKQLVDSLASSTEQGVALLAQLTELAHKSHGRISAIEEATEAMSRMLQLHTELLDKTVDRTAGLPASLAIIERALHEQDPQRGRKR